MTRHPSGLLNPHRFPADGLIRTLIEVSRLSYSGDSRFGTGDSPFGSGEAQLLNVRFRISPDGFRAEAVTRSRFGCLLVNRLDRSVFGGVQPGGLGNRGAGRAVQGQAQGAQAKKPIAQEEPTAELMR
jgi:hypothetical protein